MGTDDIQNAGATQPSNSRTVLYQLHNLIRAIDKAGEYILHDEKGFGFSQFKILSVLSNQPNSSQRYVADCLNVSPPAISRQVENMISSGLITSRVNPKNKREHLLALTMSGDAILKKAWDLLDGRFSQVMAALDKKQQQQLVDMLDKLSAQLNEA